MRCRTAAACSLDHSEPEHLRVGQQAIEVDDACGRRIGEGTVEGCAGGIQYGQLGAGCEVGEVDEEVGSFGRSQHKPLRRERYGREQQAALGADLHDPFVVGCAVTNENQTKGSGVRAIQHTDAIGRGLDLGDRPDLAIDRSERTEALHDLRIPLVEELARQSTVGADVEIAIAEQERQLVRRPLGQIEFALAFVTHDPQTGESRVDAQARHAHDVVVVPEHRGALIVRIGMERPLTGGGDVLRPSVAGCGRDPTVEVDDREPAERGRSDIGAAVAAARQALDRHTVRRVARRCDDHHWQRALEAVVPLHLDLDTAVDFDRRAWDVPAVGPHTGRRQVSVEPVRGRLEPDG